MTRWPWVLWRSCAAAAIGASLNLLLYLVLLVWNLLLNTIILGFWEEGHCCPFTVACAVKKYRKERILVKWNLIWRSTSWAKYFRRGWKNENGGLPSQRRCWFFMMGQDLLRSLKPEILGNFQFFNIVLILIVITSYTGE